jgi:hypothetical protein
MFDIRKQIPLHLTASRRLQIHDAIDAWVDPRNVMRSACLEQDAAAGIGQECHEWKNVWLQQRLSACDLNQRAFVTENRRDDFA